MNEEFYVGYLDHAPPAMARFVRRWVAAAVVVLLAWLAVIAGQQSPMGQGRFEFGIERVFEGLFLAEPLPLLRVAAPDGVGTNYVVVGLGKHGVPDVLRQYHGRRIRFRGSLIERDGTLMAEWNVPDSLEVLSPAPERDSEMEEIVMGDAHVAGELVDTKCFLGVMRPATGKVHRACAIRCLSGGVPPGLLVQREDGHAVVVMLVSGVGNVPWNVSWAGRQVKVRGVLVRRGETLILKAAEAALLGAGG
ncbi:MAG: hypothetical protein JNK85_07755 [Verrucomicrobiales bacterium]|nr:hypothetical protein [Verrucomicrobiales bacterium]